MTPLNDVGVISNPGHTEVQAWMESPDLHHTKTPGGADLICLNSMLKRLQINRHEEPSLG